MEPEYESAPAWSKESYLSYVPVTLMMKSLTINRRDLAQFFGEPCTSELQSPHRQSQHKSPFPPPLFSDSGVSNGSYSSTHRLLLLFDLIYIPTLHPHIKVHASLSYSFSTWSAPCSVRWLLGNSVLFA